ncbi:lanthionine synthetase C family protein [Actinosynnema sp. NPDC023587]|uniref:lanthionine synthetase C family protein n=1 Tax=Actinosynnema sp. NPDC023587 TaxID=3154695 RepID=UPI0033CB743A
MTVQGRGQVRDVRTAQWAQSLADGAAGTALLHLELGEDAEEWLTAMVADPVLAHPHQATLFDGAPAVAFTLAATAHHRALAAVNGCVEAIIHARLDAAHRRIDSGELPAKREFDLVSGLTGLGVYLLRRRGSTDRHGTQLADVLVYLVRLTEPRPDGLPGWWAVNGPTNSGPDWAGGHGNLGVAHGIAGPLALLALAMRREVVVPGHAEAVDRICRWLDHWRCGSGHRVWWPGAITRAEHATGTPRSDGPHRPSWCYGTLGIARAQQLAALALGDTRRQRFTQRALAWCLTDEAQLTQLSDVSLCHGWAGVLHTAWRVGEHDEQVRALVPRLAERLTEHLLHHPPTPHGLLNGEAGVRLAQRAATTDTTPITRWDACLLLDG